MNRRFAVFFTFIIAVLIQAAVSTAAPASVTFANNGVVGSSFKGKELKKLTAKITLPNKLGSYKFDQVDVFLTLSHLDVKGVVYFDRANLPADWANTNTITVNLVAESGSSDFKDSSGGSYGISDFTTSPQKQKKDKITANVQLKVFTKTGEKYDSRWDKAYNTWRTYPIPIFNAGTVLADGTMTVTLDKLTGISDNKGVFSVEFPDDSWEGNVVDKSGGVGGRRQFSVVSLGRGKDAVLPLDLRVNAFAFDINDWPEIKDKYWEGLKGSVEEEFTGSKIDLQFGWTYLIEENRYAKDDAADKSVQWSNVSLGGQSGIKASYPSRAPLYLTARPPYIIAVYAEYSGNYEDDKMGKNFFTHQQPAVMKKIDELTAQVAAKIKPLKGSAPAGGWIPGKVQPTAQGAASDGSSATPSAEAAGGAFKPGDQVSAFWPQDGKWYNAVILKAQGGKYFIHYDDYESSYDEWVTPDKLKAR